MSVKRPCAATPCAKDAVPRDLKSERFMMTRTQRGRKKPGGNSRQRDEERGTIREQDLWTVEL